MAFLSSLLVRGKSEWATMRVAGLDLGRDLYAVHDRRRAGGRLAGCGGAHAQSSA